MFVLDLTGDDINLYTLTTPFDTSTATFSDINGDGTGFDVSGQDANPTDPTFVKHLVPFKPCKTTSYIRFFQDFILTRLINQYIFNSTIKGDL